MSFMAKKKKYKFSVKVELEGMSSVPFINGVLYAKARLMDGGNFVQTSQRCEVKDHCVTWGTHFVFECKMSANASNGVLNSCMLRISVRKEGQGGRSPVKLGYVDLDLAEFAGAGLTRKRSLLEAYSNTHHRSDNSVLKLSIGMTLLHGDPLFKRPSRSSFYAPLPPTMVSSSSGAQVGSTPSSDPTTPQEGSLPPLPSLPLNLGPASLSSSSTKDSITDGLPLTGEDGLTISVPAPLHTPQLTHVGLPLETSSKKGSTASFTTSSTAMVGAAASSSTNNCNQVDNLMNGHSRNSSQQSKTGSVGYGSLEVENRVDSTRVNPEDIIQELVESNLAQTALTGDDQEEHDDVGLEIFVGKDGTATLGSRSGTNERRNKKKPQSAHQHHHSNRNSSHNAVTPLESSSVN